RALPAPETSELLLPCVWAGRGRLLMEASCLELALEGERLCKAGDFKAGVAFFEAAVQVGTEDLKTLSAIYSQLGNAYFYLKEYARALEYHKHDLLLARTIGDRMGEAKASGNLGNTLKVLGRFDEAVVCCQRHLDIAQEQGDKVGEARALYNIGNVYHAKGKQLSWSAAQDPGHLPPAVRETLPPTPGLLGPRKPESSTSSGLDGWQGVAGGDMAHMHSASRRNLSLVKELGDRAAQGRAYGNLGNTHYLLGSFTEATTFHKETLQLSRQLKDQAVEAQACYSLGNTYTLLQDYERAAEYHLRHLLIAQELADRLGEGRACWSLGNAYVSMGSPAQALTFAKKHLEISQEVGDRSGELTARMNVAQLQLALGRLASPAAAEKPDLAGYEAQGARPKRTQRLSAETWDLLRLPLEREQNGDSHHSGDWRGPGRDLLPLPVRSRKYQEGPDSAERRPREGGHSPLDSADVRVQLPRTVGDPSPGADGAPGRAPLSPREPPARLPPRPTTPTSASGRAWVSAGCAPGLNFLPVRGVGDGLTRAPGVLHFQHALHRWACPRPPARWDSACLSDLVSRLSILSHPQPRAMAPALPSRPHQGAFSPERWCSPVHT
uniref:G protein signaling modulator 1 n=1 Tax=Capra hircus TaxID=9925 RepID=A0A452DK14_CAPHI